MADLQQNAVAYLGSDTNDRGWLGVAGSHSLQTFFEQVARDITDPLTGKSVLQALMDHRAAERPKSDTSKLEYRIGALGSGSDYTAYIDHIGIPSANVAYGGATHDGIYHSIYDSYDFYTRFLDTSFVYGVAEAQTTGTAILRLADAPVLPFQFANVVATYRRYADEIQKEAKQHPETKALDLSDVQQALDRLQQASERYEQALAPLPTTPSRMLQAHRKELAALNRTLFMTERALTDTAGLEKRPWFRHLIYAPGFYTGYGVKTMPGIREAVEDVPNGEVAQREAARVAAAIDRMAVSVNGAADQLQRILGTTAVGNRR